MSAIFNFELSYFVVSRKEMEVDNNNSISNRVFYNTYSNNEFVAICKMKTNCLKF